MTGRTEPARTPGQLERPDASGERPLHVAIFLSEPSGGGAQRRTITLANELARRNVAVTLLLARECGPLRPLISDRIRVCVVGGPWAERWPVRWRRSWRVLASIPGLAAALREAPPDVLLSAANHVHRAVAVAHWRSGARVPLVMRLSNHLTRTAWSMRRAPRPLRLAATVLALRRASLLVAVSDAVADDVSRVARIPRAAIRVIHNPVVNGTIESLAAQDPQHPWLRPGEPPVVLGVARLVAQKDLPTLVRAFARVRRQRRVRLIILGGGRERARRRLQALARRLGVSADVHLPGFVPNPYAYMARSAVFVLSSAWEGLPGALIEAMACGCPVVSTDCPGGAAEILEGGRYGPLVPVGDDAKMAAAISEMLDRPTPATQLRQRAAAFSATRQVTAWVDVLREAAERTLAPQTPCHPSRT